MAMDPRDVERVRLPAERAIGAEMGLIEAAAGPIERAVRERRRAQLLAGALPLTPEIAPGVHALLARACARLGVVEPVELYQSRAQENETWNAAHVGCHAGAVVLELRGSAIELLDDEALVSVLGHELGHHLAHSELRWHWPDTETGPPRDGMRLRVARELTADRFGLLAEPSLAASLRAEMGLRSGLKSGAGRLDVEAYRAWCVAWVEGKLALRRGFTIAKGARVLMVEDIVTTGLSSRECIAGIAEEGGAALAAACLLDRSGGKADLGVPLFALTSLEIPAYPADALPPELAALPAVKPGSRGLAK